MTPQILQINGIAARAMSRYYGMPMGGAFGNGNDAAAINFLQKTVIEQNPIPQDVSFEFSSAVSATDDKTVDITVKATASKDIPADVRLHIIVTEKRIYWENVWPEGVTDGKTSNGQDFMYDVIWDIIGDTLGNEFPSITAGQSHSMTHPFTLYDDMGQNADSIEVTAVLQVESTKQILAISRMVGSPYNSGNPIISNGLIKGMSKLSLNTSGLKANFKLPFEQTNLTLYNTSGKTLLKRDFNGKVGTSVSFNLPESKGVMILKMSSQKGDMLTKRLILK